MAIYNKHIVAVDFFPIFTRFHLLFVQLEILA